MKKLKIENSPKVAAGIMLGFSTLMCVVLVLSVYQYLSLTRVSVEESANSSLHVSAINQRELFNTKIDGVFSVLEAFSTSIASQDSYEISDICARMQNIIKLDSNIFTDMGISALDGQFSISDGSTLDASGRNFYMASLNGEKYIEHATSSEYYNDRFIFSTPIIKDSKVIGVLTAKCNSLSFESALLSNTYGEFSNSFICKGNGEIVLANETVRNFVGSTNFFNIINKDNLIDNDYAHFKNNFSTLNSGTVRYLFNGEQRYAVYNPLGINDWMIINVVPESVIDVDTASATKVGWIMFVTTCVTLSLIALALIWFLRINRKFEHENSINLMLSQIKPHFLYNTLSAIKALIIINPKTASDLILNFSKYMRNNLDSLTHSDLSTLEDELSHTKSYLEIEKVRFPGQVNVKYNLLATGFNLPMLTIQPIVENCVKLGILPKSEPGTLKITTNQDDKYYFIEIEDDGQGFGDKKTDRKKYAGLETVKYRLENKCKGKLLVQTSVNTGTVVSVLLPKKGLKSAEKKELRKQKMAERMYS